MLCVTGYANIFTEEFNHSKVIKFHLLLSEVRPILESVIDVRPCGHERGEPPESVWRGNGNTNGDQSGTHNTNVNVNRRLFWWLKFDVICVDLVYLSLCL